MGKYIKEFNNHTEYEEFVGQVDFNLQTPNVSLCNRQNEVHYSPLVHNYSKDYLTFEIINNGTLIWNYISTGISFDSLCIDYSIDGGITWNSICGSSDPFLNAVVGQKILFKGVHSTYEVHQTIFGTVEESQYKFSGTASFNVSGNLMSMIGGDNFQNTTTFGYDAFRNLFSNCNVIDAKNLIFPETTTSYCYQRMFYNCSSLISAPELPSTDLKALCYDNMFYNCTSLTTAPKLLATTPGNYCYRSMFEGCTNLNKIICLATNISALDCTKNWLSGVASTGTFTKAASMTSWTTGPNGIPENWTVVDAS